MKGGLFVLTKIDLSENKEKKIEECKQYFINHISSEIFNIYFNVFVPLNSIQFNIEMFMKKDIKYYFLYYYRKYYDNIVIVSGNNNNELTFIDFLENEIKNYIGEEEYEVFIDDAKENFSMNDLNKIKETYEEIKKNTNQTIKFGINFDDEDDESIEILKGLYKLYKDNTYFPELSESTKEIINYFKNYEKKTPTSSENNGVLLKKKSKLDLNIEKLNNIFNKLKSYIDENENDKNSNIAILNSHLKKLEKYIKNGKNIYIPFIGNSSAGKSTILNCILGFRLFPESDNECTTRGIIIKYGKDIELYEIKVDTVKNFYVFEEDRLVSKGIKNVQSYLNCLNYQYGKDESKYFYLIKTPIKLFDDYEFDEDLKEKILLVDLPGCDTSNNKFNEHDKIERTVYEKLLEISSSFVFVNKDRPLKNIENKKILENIYKMICDNNFSLSHNCLKYSLFLINMFGELSDNEKDNKNIKKEILNILFNKKNKEKNNVNKLENINTCLFNAKKYMEYLKEKDKLCVKYLFVEFQNNFKKKKRKKNFVKFFYDSLKTRCKDIDMEIEENFECNDDKFFFEIKNTLLELMKISNIKYDESENKHFKNISNILFYIKENIKKNKLYVESNCEDFFENLKSQIRKAKNYIDGNYNNNIRQCFRYFDMIFEKEIDKEKTNNQKKLRAEKENIINQVEELEKKYEIEKIFDKYSEKINEIFDKIKENKESLISKHDKNIEKLVKEEIEDEMKRILEKKLQKEIDDKLLDLNDEISICKTTTLDLFKITLEKEIKKGKYKVDIEDIYKFSFYEKIQLKLSKISDFSTFSKTALKAIGVGALFTIGFCISVESLVLAILIAIGSYIADLIKSKSKIFDKKIEEISLKYSAEFERMRRKFSRLYKDTLNETKNLFEEFLSVASIDLSKIEEEEWNNLKANYHEIKKIIINLLSK